MKSHLVVLLPFLAHGVLGFGVLQSQSRYPRPMNSSHQTSRGDDGTRILFTLKMAVQEESSSSNNNNIEIDDLSTTSDSSTTMGKIMEETKQVKCPNCDLCDGSGRIIGGIGQVLDWWPIKAYRPCPNFINNGGQYTKLGQSLDEIAFGKKNL